MKMNVLNPFASPKTMTPSRHPIDIPKTLNSNTFVHFSSNLPIKSKTVAKKNHTPQRFNFSIVTN